MPAPPRPLADRFWEKVDKTENCWLWTGSKKRPPGYPYGFIVGEHTGTRKGRLRQAHRVSYELHYGPIPEGMCVCHSCDQPSCVRPDHLFLGSQKDNLRDAEEKQRLARAGNFLGPGNKYT